jgi:hypothetical protein
MGLKKLDFKNFKRHLGKFFGHTLRAYDVKHLKSDLVKREIKTPLFTMYLPFKNLRFHFL